MTNLPEYMESMDAREAFELGVQVLKDMEREVETDTMEPLLWLNLDEDELTIFEASLDWFDETTSRYHLIEIWIDDDGEFQKEEVSHPNNGMPDFMNKKLKVTAEERIAFLKRQGWEQMNADEREALEAIWHDTRIRMALDLNLA